MVSTKYATYLSINDHLPKLENYKNADLKFTDCIAKLI